MTPLARANLVLLGALVGHILDHSLNQDPRTLPATGAAVGIAGFAIVASSAVLAIWRRALAPQVGLAAAVATAGGFIAVHLLPSWSHAVSDPYWTFHPNVISWLLIASPLAASAWLARVSLQSMPVAAPAR